MVLHQQQEPYTGKFKTYSKEQKQKALLLVEKIGKAETARKMNITYSAINNWVSAAKKGYCCSECGKALSDSTELKKHERRKHGKHHIQCYQQHSENMRLVQNLQNTNTNRAEQSNQKTGGGDWAPLNPIPKEDPGGDD